MGTTSGYKCNKCKYEYAGSAGPDRGGDHAVETFVCEHCSELVDVKIPIESFRHLSMLNSEAPGSEKSNSTRAKKVIYKGLAPSDKRKNYTCPICHHKRGLKTWDHQKMICPKNDCGGKMEFDAKAPIIDW